MLDHLCERPLIEKTRHREEFEGIVGKSTSSMAIILD
jgi:hypothetical protein